MEDAPVVLFDCNNTLYRMYHAQPPRTHQGERVESVQGALKFFRSFSEQHTPKGLADSVVVIDAEGPTFRDELDPNYKCDRKGMPEELKTQEALTEQCLMAMGVPTLKKSGYEADDALGMVANHYVNQGRKCLIVTTDKDMMQLVDENITIFNPASKKMITPAGVYDKFFVMPDRVVDVMSIMGDSVDSIYGVEGVGLKTAAKWVNEYGCLDGLINNCDTLKGKAGVAFQACVDRVHHNRSLITIRSHPSLLTDDERQTLSDIQANEPACRELSDRINAPITAISDDEPAQTTQKPRQDPGPAQGALF